MAPFYDRSKTDERARIESCPSQRLFPAIATVAAIFSAVAAYMAYRIAALQALPHPDIGWTSSTSGHRSLDFKVTRAPGSAEWVVASVSIRGNWRRRRQIARGYLVHAEDVDGEIVGTYEASGPWQHRIIFDPPLTEGAIFLGRDYVATTEDRLSEPQFQPSPALPGLRAYAQDYLGAGIVPTPQPR